MADRTRLVKRFIDWLDHHPRLGWYIAVMVTLDVLLQIGEELVR